MNIYNHKTTSVLFPNQPFHGQDLISNSPYCLQYRSYDVTLINWESPKLIYFFIYLSSWYSINIVRINSILVTHGGERVW